MARTGKAPMTQNSRRLTILATAGASLIALRRWRRSCRRIDFAGKTVVISGASRGLGLELARQFAYEGANLILLARDEDSLLRSASELGALGARVTPIVCDITRSSDVQKSVESIVRQTGGIDVLINNAGIIQVGPFENMTVDDYEQSMQVHFRGPLYLIQRVVPMMQAARFGRIVNIASIGGKVAVPHLLPYVASKFALVGLSEGLRAELLKDGIYVTTVMPGLMRTGSHLQALFKGQYKKEYAWFALAGACPLLSTSAPSAARRIIDACRYGDGAITITPQAQLLRIAHGVFPGLVADLLGAANRLLPRPNGENLPHKGLESRSALSPSFLTRSIDRAAAVNNELPDKASKGFNNYVLDRS
ncbi:MAG: SDR family NAD(P)-dependent oxidoreductase [Candidatus Binatia bacterium]